MEQKVSIGVDVSKNTLDLAIYAGEFDFSKHTRVSNNDTGFKAIETWIGKQGIALSDICFTMEFTGLYAQDFRVWLEKKEVTYFMVSPKKMHDFSVPVNTRGLGRSKTDFLDSFKIAYYGFSNWSQLRPSRLPSHAFLSLKRLIAERLQYTRQIAVYEQQLHDISRFDSERSQQRKKDARAILKGKIKDLDIEADTVIATDPAIAKSYALLTSVIAVGRVVATECIVLTENFTAISDPRVYAHYIGVAPDKKQSGVSVRSRDRTDNIGFRQAKADLSMTALAAIRFDPQIKAYWKRKKKEGKPGGVVLNAIKFKLILRMFAVVRKQKPFVKLDF